MLLKTTTCSAVPHGSTPDGEAARLMSEPNDPPRPDRIEDALFYVNQALRREMAVHKAMGVPWVVWREGKVHWVAPEDLPDFGRRIARRYRRTQPRHVARYTDVEHRDDGKVTRWVHDAACASPPPPSAASCSFSALPLPCLGPKVQRATCTPTITPWALHRRRRRGPG